MNKYIAIVFCLFLSVDSSIAHDFTGNPLIPGYLSNPSVVFFEGKYWMYGTTYSEGDETLTVWESKDFMNWTYHQLIWPKKEVYKKVIKSPSVIQGNKGGFYMYVTIGANIYVMKAHHPLGPWKNAIADDKSLLAPQDEKAEELTGANPFIDKDGQHYLFWSSKKVDGKAICFVSGLKKMTSLSKKKIDFTPNDYSGSPNMVNHNGKYFFFYSSGNIVDSTYKVKYLVLEKPMKRSKTNEGEIVLSSAIGRDIIGPGNSAVLHTNNQYYIIYDRIYNKKPGKNHRQVCADQIHFTKNSKIAKVVPSNKGIPFFLPTEIEQDLNLALWRLVLTSSNLTDQTSSLNCVDHIKSTMWAASENDMEPSLFIDLREERIVNNIRIMFEYPDKSYKYRIEYSLNKKNWFIFVDSTFNNYLGSPAIFHKEAKGRYFRIVFVKEEFDISPGIWEIEIY